MMPNAVSQSHISNMAHPTGNAANASRTSANATMNKRLCSMVMSKLHWITQSHFGPASAPRGF